jgi:hypothetical protein
MWVAVEFTHLRGVKLRAGQAHPRGTLQGELVSYVLQAGCTSAVSLKTSLNVTADLAVMYRPRFVGVGGEVFRLAGLERAGDPSAWVHQEWICLPKPRPSDLLGEPSRARRP